MEELSDVVVSQDEICGGCVNVKSLVKCFRSKVTVK